MNKREEKTMKKVAVLYYSKSGNTQKMAEIICQGIKETGIEAETFSIDSVDVDYVKGCDGIIIGTPTYHGTYCAKIKLLFEEQFGEFEPAGKTGGAFATAAYIHGGGDTAVLGILNHMLFYGMKAYSGGCAYGAPVIHYGPVGISENIDDFEGLFREYGRRFARV
jgi:NAD(P)H dehydrogenase (quinone)